jgi:hypothetical protein
MGLDASDGIYCGYCKERLGNILEHVWVFGTESGTLIVGIDRAIHRCATLTRTDEMEAMRRIAEDVKRRAQCVSSDSGSGSGASP